MKIMKLKKRTAAGVFAALLLLATWLNTVGCSMNANAADLMEGIRAGNVTGKQADAAFISESANFAIELLQSTAEKDTNTTISPLSVMLALAMTANGAAGETKKQMEEILGGDIPLETLNEYLYAYIKALPSEDSSKLQIANAVWFRDGMNVSRDFLQKNADYFQADAYRSAFDEQTVRDINKWVKDKTDGTIEKIIEGDTIDAAAMMYLINALSFDAEWENVYEKTDIRAGIFHTANGAEQSVEMMCSTEYGYIDDGRATGFIKPYKGNHYSFAALLPNEDISLDAYISSLNGDSFVKSIENAKANREAVWSTMPKFSYDTELELREALSAMGMAAVFDSQKADFSMISEDDLYVNQVLHKTHISVDELGTKAGAVTAEIMLGAAFIENTVTLDRPFLYAIIDNATNLPVFMGTVTNFEG